MSVNPRLVMGGTFDPIHIGHLEIAEGVRHALEAPSLWLMPTAVPPHKAPRNVTPAHHRIAMVEAALRDRPGLRVCNLEFGGEVSYTIDSLRRLREGPPRCDPVFVLGMDSVIELPTWHEHESLIEEFDMIAIARPDTADAAGLPTEIAPHVRPPVEPESAAARLAGERLGRGGRIFPLRLPAHSVSSRMIRRAVEEGRYLRNLVPEPVARYIREHGLYGGASS